MPAATQNTGGTAATTSTTTTATPGADDAQRAQQLEAERQALLQAERQRVADITALCQRHNQQGLAAGMIERGDTIEQARAAVLDAMAGADQAGGGHRNVRGIQTTRDEHDTRLRGVEEMLMHRVDARAELTDNGRQFRGMTLIEVGRELLEARGVDTRGMTRMNLAGAMLRGGAMGTSDFPALLGNVAGRRLRAAYEQHAGTYTRWARKAPNAPDFKTITVVQMSGAPELMQTNEHGEFTYGSASDGQETYSLLTYGRMVHFTRQSIVNDDLRGFDRMIAAFGNSGARLENRLVYAELTAGKVGGKVVFHADNKNLGTGAGTALSLDALKAGRLAMRKQVGLQKEQLNLAPRHLIVPSDLEQVAYQLTSANYVPAKAADTNEFRAGGRTEVEPIVEPLLDGASATAWYLAADAAQVDTVEYCWLDGAEGPVIDSEIGFEVDGIRFRCREDFAAKVLDFRGLYSATGAA